MASCPGCKAPVPAGAVACPRCGAMVNVQHIPVWTPAHGRRQPAGPLGVVVIVALGLGLVLLFGLRKPPGPSEADLAELKPAQEASVLMSLYAFDCSKYPNFATDDIPALLRDEFKTNKHLKVPPEIADYEWNPAFSLIIPHLIDFKHDTWVLHSRTPDSDGRYVVAFLNESPKLVMPDELAKIEKMPLVLNADGPGTRYDAPQPIF